MINPDPIIVTAAKQPIALRDIARAVSVLRLSDAQAHDAQSASMTIAPTLTDDDDCAGAGAQPHVPARRGRQPVQRHEPVHRGGDDRRCTPHLCGAGPDLRLVDVDRVELLKGPQGSLYGTGALGGIYHIVTRRADPHRFEASVTRA
jgi:hypothetical protein